MIKQHLDRILATLVTFPVYGFALLAILAIVERYP